jgi:hypothetical protein
VLKEADPAIEFRFTRTEIELFGYKVTELTIQGKQKTYRFVGTHKGMLVIRSSQGGLTLFVDTERIPQYRPKVDFLATKL